MVCTFRAKFILACTAALMLAACSFDTSGLKQTAFVTCGNGVLNEGEDCDRALLNQKTCETLGYIGGTLACASDCTFDVSACIPPTCGDGVKEGFEVCDGANLGEETCVTQGFFAGVLLCAADCRSFDTSSCSFCGNGVLDEGETCDGTDLNGKTCQSLSFFAGELACMPNCRGVITTGCTNCGNGNLEVNEVCDGTAGIGETCLDRGCRSGVVTCAPDCGSLIFSNCYVGHDEDNDGIDDNCDNCPTIPNPQQANNDHDQIGDNCESEDPTLVNGIQFFDPFTAPSSAWKSYTGNWTVHADDITGDTDLTTTGNYYYDSLSLPAHGYSVETTFFFTSDPSFTDISPYAAVTFGWRMDGIGGTLSDAWACAWKRKDNKLSLLHFNTVWSEVASQTVTTSAGNHQWRRLRADVSANNIACSYTDESMSSTQRIMYTNTSSVDGKVGLRINETSAVFTSFMVYGTLSSTTK